jgi:hypothetical protein
MQINEEEEKQIELINKGHQDYFIQQSMKKNTIFQSALILLSLILSIADIEVWFASHWKNGKYTFLDHPDYAAEQGWFSASSCLRIINTVVILLMVYTAI